MTNLPASIRVFERGWLSSNNVLLVDDACVALVDTGYATHAPQTLALVQQALGARPLDLIVNTHLHSDHCGGNALLQSTWPCRTAIPASEADAVRDWDESRLTFRATGQTCERFTFTETIAPGAQLRLGALDWQVLGAPGHDPHSLMLYCPDERILISADALWENGFGVIFPELEGESGFAEEQAVLEAIAKLDVRLVIPGHGSPFTNVEQALERAFSRVAWLRADPARNAKNALKVLIVFKLLEVRAMSFDTLLRMLDDAAAMRAAATMFKPRGEWPTLVHAIVEELAAKNGPLAIDGERIVARQA
ncbi:MULTISPECIES: MBL fold metallo-hydrolase [Paraburkholderia]|jgi:glyoxylase-like metal-dependent hydrolase (beta-lactamase superfamily II)|uniref:MBL fold metallo-hydrolase n=1 Tax=Paraburkholderia TaxID=1822464 RepID=UPI0015595E30|nr:MULTISPECIES: MBL fold metallo-hydrolase [Paraburkholderia]MCX4176760.1 MBL fold metallo-hydrolase [Paraburkholderia madseniana]MDQ6464751.1 MBL fold metallo-hydrolase [Paraburkholderia madseniana]NPT63000.1 MBL fold metallo-hydrolase [Paraburkholderia madseniana]